MTAAPSPSSSSPSSSIGTQRAPGAFPTLEQLRSDPFLKQVRHAEFVVRSLRKGGDFGRDDDDDTEGTEGDAHAALTQQRLRAQLSHAAGIRGLMVTFLTAPRRRSDRGSDEKQAAAAVNPDIANGQQDENADDEDDDDDIPAALVAAVLEQIDPVADGNDLVALLGMNVIMPTAMVTLHHDAALSRQSARTAARAARLLTALLRAAAASATFNHRHDAVRAALTVQCEAILAAATAATTIPPTTPTPDALPPPPPPGGGAASRDVAAGAASGHAADRRQRSYWQRFLAQYQPRQMADIANAVRTILLAAPR